MDGERVAILLATMNGADFLDEQLSSLAAQSHPQIDIWVSEDGSTDGTLDILDRWRRRWTKGAFVVLLGPGNGFAENFRALLTNREIDADYFAYCDQDDLWEAEKLATALRWMRSGIASRPLLFCSRTLTVSATGRPIGCSPLFRLAPSFRNALVQSIAGGNTMVFNRTARNRLAHASRRAGFVSHDWWSYLIVTGTGGEICYSTEPLVRYRQHANNQIGANTTLRARLAHVKRLLVGGTAAWIGRNLKGLEINSDLLTPEAKLTVSRFARARTGGIRARVNGLRDSGVYRQTAPGAVMLWLGVLMRRV